MRVEWWWLLDVNNCVKVRTLVEAATEERGGLRRRGAVIKRCELRRMSVRAGPRIE